MLSTDASLSVGEDGGPRLYKLVLSTDASLSVGGDGGPRLHTN